jgi:hypothetical protein
MDEDKAKKEPTEYGFIIRGHQIIHDAGTARPATMQEISLWNTIQDMKQSARAETPVVVAVAGENIDAGDSRE